MITNIDSDGTDCCFGGSNIVFVVPLNIFTPPDGEWLV